MDTIRRIKMRKMQALIGLSILLGLLVTACSPSAPPAEPTPLPPTQAPAATAAAVFEPLSVSAGCESGSIIQEIAALDEKTVRFSLCRSDPAFLSKAAFIAFAIQPREHLEASAGDRSILENPVGTGPWMFDRWDRGDSIIFKQFEGYWGSSTFADTLVFRWTKEAAGRWLELESGNVDGIDFPSPDDYETILANPDHQLLFKAPLNNFYLGMNNKFPPFDDVRVRKAIAMGIDRQRLVDTFYPLGSKVATHFTPCEIANGCAGDPWYEFDPEAARALLAEAGFADGFSTSIFYRDVVRSYLPEVSQIAQELQNQLAENLGIDAKIELFESGEFVARAGEGSLDGLHMYGWIADFPHITNFLDTHFGETSVRFGSLPPEIYQPILEAAQIADAEKAEPLYAEANNAIREFIPMIPMVHAVSAAAYKADVLGATASPLSTDNFAVMDPGGRDILVWMQNAEPISLYCADETDSESLRSCAQILESLYSYVPGGTDFEPALATSCEENEDSTVWTCNLREGVLFHDGSLLDANDVVASWVAGWDASSPLHVGSTGIFEYYSTLFGLINVP
jgi:peptide/nickel transport system substrate-binding protein